MSQSLDTFCNETENLEILAEECAEVAQIKSKIIRFGLDDFHPKNEVRNREALERELGHLQAMVMILVANGTITQAGIDAGVEHKIRKLALWYGGNRGSMANIDIHQQEAVNSVYEPQQ